MTRDQVLKTARFFRKGAVTLERTPVGLKKPVTHDSIAKAKRAMRDYWKLSPNKSIALKPEEKFPQEQREEVGA